MIPYIYFSWPPALWINWWRHAGDGSRVACGPATIVVAAPAMPAPAAPSPTDAAPPHFAAEAVIVEPPPPPPAPEPTVAERIIPFPFERVNRRARILARSAELIILGAPRPA